MDKYKAITKMLKDDKNLSLHFWCSSLHYGIENSRRVSIQEPNPYEGKVANPEAGLDTQYCHGPRWEKRGYEFFARHTVQGIDLLEKRARGDENVKDTVYSKEKRISQWQANTNYVHGLKIPKPGIDSWVFNEFSFDLRQSKDGKLYTKAESIEWDTRGFELPLLKVNNVQEMVDYYDNNPVDSKVIKNLQKALIMKEKGKKFSGLKKGVLTDEFLKECNAAINQLKPFNIPEDVLGYMILPMIQDKF